MKVLIINTYERGGGAAVAATRLADALCREGLEVRMLVADRTSVREDVATVYVTRSARICRRVAFYAERLSIFLHNGFDRQRLFYVSTAQYGTDISQHPWVKEWADVIHLHWINHGFLSLKGLGRLSSLDRPVVWTMHDMWPVTAICHHAGGCSRYTESRGCGACPHIGSRRERDLAAHVARIKAKVIAQLRPVIVGCSQWIADTARRSIYTQGLRITDIPNPLDIDLFHPMNQAQARASFDLPNDAGKCLILFGAVQADDKRKGIEELSRALELLRNHHPELCDHLELIVFGHLSNEAVAALDYFDMHRVGYIDQAEEMAKLYNAVDVFVIPSLEENLPNTIMESLACGTPCVGFRVGGIPEMIIDGQNGYVADYRSAKSLANCIYQIAVMQTQERESLRNRCRQSAISRYETGTIARRYSDLYDEIVS